MVTYTDEEGKEHSLNHPSLSKGALLLVIFLSLVLGAAGGIGGLLLLGKIAPTQTNQIESVIPGITKVEKVTVEEDSATIDAVKKVSPTVVSVTTTRSIEDFFGTVSEQKGGGTGFILTSDGLILTNKHVVSDAKADYTIYTLDGKSFKPKSITTDPFNDLAIIKIEATGLPPVELGDSEKIQIGQRVIAIGNALAEFQNTVTTGVISAVGRKVEAGSDSSGSTESLENLIQTDAAINPGNSGGPLINIRGQVIGINTAMAGNAENIGFAIPINTAKSAIDSYKKTGKIVRPMVGIRYIPLTKDLADKYDLPVDKGAWIYPSRGISDVAIIPSSPADKAGIKENDIVTKINGEEVNDAHSLAGLIQQYKPGDEVELTLMRKGQELKIKVVLDEYKAK
jgi:serine protease Do